MLLRVVVPELCLERVAGEDDGLLVVAAQAALDHVQLQLQEVVQPRHLVLKQAHVVHVEPVDYKYDIKSYQQ